jgi:capsular exopolysaccharide synthesis family protein
MSSGSPSNRTISYDLGAPLPIAEQLVSLRAPGSFAADQYRTLRHAIERRRVDSGLQVLVVTSSAPGDGKSITALNLAGTLAQSRTTKVLIIDADLRRPSLGRYLGIEDIASPGLAEAIIDEQYELSDVVMLLPRFNLAVVPAGAAQAAPYELLNSSRLEALISEARREYDYVIIDTPPLVPFPDCRVLGRHTDGYLVIVAAHKTPRKLLLEGLALLDPSKVVGVLFNGDDRPLSNHYGYYAYYHPGSRERKHWWRRA